MIRVIYRWTLHPEHMARFVAAWWDATELIQTSVPGARGSVLLRSQTDPHVVIAVARWDSLEAWQAGRQPVPDAAPDPNVVAMNASTSAATTYEIFDELLDWPWPIPGQNPLPGQDEATLA
ncbi:MAG: antibiotic biosynthesis monooxygenase family protein [Massilia sp.]